MGDGVERALARAAELEALVHNEVSALERAYNDNEVRIRDLLSELSNQRETLVSQAEHVRNAIASVHLDLAHDITSVGDLVADKVSEVAQRVTRSLTEKGEHITLGARPCRRFHDRCLKRARLDPARPAGNHQRPRHHRDSPRPATGCRPASISRPRHVHDEFADLAGRLQQMMTVAARPGRAGLRAEGGAHHRVHG